MAVKEEGVKGGNEEEEVAAEEEERLQKKGAGPRETNQVLMEKTEDEWNVFAGVLGSVLLTCLSCCRARRGRAGSRSLSSSAP